MRNNLGFRHLVPLTERELEELANAYRGGASLADLSLIAGRSPQVVRKALAAAGVTIRPPSSYTGGDPFRFSVTRRCEP
jgi:hypothetical protein